MTTSIEISQTRASKTIEIHIDSIGENTARISMFQESTKSHIDDSFMAIRMNREECIKIRDAMNAIIDEK